MDIRKIISSVTSKNRVSRMIVLLLGIFLLALNYNIFFLKYEIVIGGTSGLAIIFNKLWGWDAQIFIYFTSFLLVLVSLYVFGIEKTKITIIGSILYPLMITLTVPLSNMLAKYLVFEDFITTIAFTAILYGFANGLIYKVGFNTGGADVIMQIMGKYFHMSSGKASFISNLIIILLAAVTLGFSKVIYAIIILYVSSVIVDKMLIGISKSKLFYIESEHIKEIKEVIIRDLHLGVTLVPAKGGYSKKNKNLLLCVVPTKDYYMFKEIILAIDKDAFFIINDCYDTEGGTTRIKETGLDNYI